jgi:hypothetical protein
LRAIIPSESVGELNLIDPAGQHRPPWHGVRGGAKSYEVLDTILDDQRP